MFLGVSSGRFSSVWSCLCSLGVSMFLGHCLDFKLSYEKIFLGATFLFKTVKHTIVKKKNNSIEYENSL